METRQIAGVALLLVGILFVTNIIPLATVIYPREFWYQLYPDGTNDNPTIVAPGQQITLSAKIVYHCSTEGIELPSPAYWVVTVTITASGYSKTVNLGRPDKFLSSVVIDGHYTTVAVWEELWTVPSGEGVVYAFKWSVTIKDDAGNDYGTQTKTTYAKTADVEPDGTFKVNGKDASQTSSLVVLSPNLNFEFTPTKNADKIISVYVEVWKGSSKLTAITLTKGAASYTGSYTLPGYGVYTLKGFVSWSGGSIPKMSITASWGEEEPPFIEGLRLNHLVGFASIIAGAVLLFKRD
jgi:hypothetical protein